MKPKFKIGDVVEFSRLNDGYYLGRTKEYGTGPFIVVELSWGGCGVNIAKLEDGLRFASFHEDNMVRNEFLTAVHKAQKQAKRKAGENAA